MSDKYSGKIVSVIECLKFDFDYGIGGETVYMSLGSIVHIETKYDTHYTGILVGFEVATKEGMQDSLVIWTQEDVKKNVGIHDIILIERTYRYDFEQEKNKERQARFEHGEKIK